MDDDGQGHAEYKVNINTQQLCWIYHYHYYTRAGREILNVGRNQPYYLQSVKLYMSIVYIPI